MNLEGYLSSGVADLMARSLGQGALPQEILAAFHAVWLHTVKGVAFDAGPSLVVGANYHASFYEQAEVV